MSDTHDSIDLDPADGFTDDAARDASAAPDAEDETFLRNIIDARQDVVSLFTAGGERAGKVSENLAKVSSKTLRQMQRLCLLADLQARFLVARFRMLALTRLVGLATTITEADAVPAADLQRKACVDLARLAWMLPDDASAEEDDEEREQTADAFFEEMRAEIFGPEKAA